MPEKQELTLSDLLAWNHARHFNYRAKLFGKALASAFTGKDVEVDEERLKAEIEAEHEAARKIVENYNGQKEDSGNH